MFLCYQIKFTTILNTCNIEFNPKYIFDDYGDTPTELDNHNEH